MDTSEQYIKMRRAAIPDLGLGTLILSSMFVVTEDVSVDNKGDFYIHCDRAPYWCQLERQDQLQVLSGLSWQEFDKECLKYKADTKEQAGIQVVKKILASFYALFDKNAKIV